MTDEQLSLRLRNLEDGINDARSRAGDKGHFWVLILLIMILTALMATDERVQRIEKRLGVVTEQAK